METTERTTALLGRVNDKRIVDFLLDTAQGRAQIHPQVAQLCQHRVKYLGRRDGSVVSKYLADLSELDQDAAEEESQCMRVLERQEKLLEEWDVCLCAQGSDEAERRPIAVHQSGTRLCEQVAEVSRLGTQT